MLRPKQCQDPTWTSSFEFHRGTRTFFFSCPQRNKRCYRECRSSNHKLLSWSSVFEQIQSWFFVFGGPSSFHLRLLFPSWSCPACAFTQADLLKWGHLQAHAQLIFRVQMCFELLSSSFVWLWRCTKCLTLFTKRASTKICFIKLHHYWFTVLLLFLFGARPDSKASNCSIPILQWLGRWLQWFRASLASTHLSHLHLWSRPLSHLSLRLWPPDSKGMEDDGLSETYLWSFFVFHRSPSRSFKAKIEKSDLLIGSSPRDSGCIRQKLANTATEAPLSTVCIYPLDGRMLCRSV